MNIFCQHVCQISKCALHVYVYNISMDSLKILTVNCQGLGDINKRKDVFDYLKTKNCDIYCIQDTHFTCEIENQVRSTWGNDIFFSSFASNSRGVAICFNNTFEYKVFEREKRSEW